MFFCIPILFGCQTKLKPEADQIPRVCPRCHNASVLPAKKTTWFEFFFIPVVPLSRKHILMCTICGWQAAIVDSEQAPTSAKGGGNPMQLRSAQGWEAPSQPGYQPAYINQPQHQK
ncbi:hypothetical protein Agabi119p4_3196 [Agaricus bisporus var. burnettii]|uniref:Zinc-ribbon 15 domain-containing protein n=1 Tax=Agaricus bisporus var. burnettii TaxID=192524 RepID=A0A8H7KJ57_AGABI|nr:hypothetical protein AGABI2DRAFT_199731 [Agaricus bisporus var. bisporus H97]EKV50213.1 hypothetical protein AGABI2DRAFT_199731 [Agaricus bisporus var. bisporus H97]KAF7778851.1 hypothetical protein Agabi119p4_3196 [Agaricus bisporus var. burnettii]